MKKVINQYYRKVYRHTNGFILTLKNFDVLYYFNFINNTKIKYGILLVRRENAELNNIKQHNKHNYTVVKCRHHCDDHGIYFTGRVWNHELWECIKKTLSPYQAKIITETIGLCTKIIRNVHFAFVNVIWRPVHKLLAMWSQLEWIFIIIIIKQSYKYLDFYEN